MAERNSICTKTTDLEANSLTFAFAHGETIVVTLEQLKPVLAQLALHGGSQKLGDLYARTDGPEEAYNKVKEGVTRLESGEWFAKRTRGEASVALFIEAIARCRNESVADISLKFESLPEETQKAVKTTTEVKAMIATIRAERANARAASDTSGGPNALDAFDAT